MKNIFYKILSFILAFVFWFFVQGSERQEINRKIEIHIHVPNNVILRGSSVRYKDATLSGPRSFLGNFSDSPIVAHISLPSRPLGKIRIRVDKEFIPDWNPKINLTIHDAYLNLFLDEKISKQIPLKEILFGRLQNGMTLDHVTLDPKVILVTGLKTEILALKEILLKPIDISSLEKNSVMTASLAIPPQLSSSTVFSKMTSQMSLFIKPQNIQSVESQHHDVKEKTNE